VGTAPHDSAHLAPLGPPGFFQDDENFDSPVGQNLFHFPASAVFEGLEHADARVRAKSNFVKPLNRLARSRRSSKNISVSFLKKLVFAVGVPHRQKGRIAIVTNVERNAVDVDVPKDERH
jgi:hypothetical protein